MGKFGIGEINDNGLRLLFLAAANKLVVGNSLFRHPRKYQLILQAPNGKDASILGHFIVRSRFRISLMDVRTMSRGLRIRSSSCMCNATSSIQTIMTEVGHHRSTKMVETCRSSKTTAFSNHNHNRFAAHDEVNDGHEAAETFSKVIDECTREICPTVHQWAQSWISDESLKLVHQRRQCKLANMALYRQLNKELHFHLKNERNAYRNNVVQELEGATHRREYRYLCTTLHRLGGKVKRTSKNIKNNDCTFLRPDSERLNRWKKYFWHLYN